MKTTLHLLALAALAATTAALLPSCSSIDEKHEYDYGDAEVSPLPQTRPAAWEGNPMGGNFPQSR